MIAPVIPDKWPGFKATRVFRGVRYVIEVKRQRKGNDVALTVDGKAIAGNVVPLPAGGTKEVRVEVALG
jgi:cellobiose phosphorylase